MESDAHEMRAEMERGEAAPWIRYRPGPWWVGPFFGTYLAVLALAVASWFGNRILEYAIMVALLASAFLLMWYKRRREGVLILPGRGTPPPEIDRVLRGFLWGMAALALVLGTSWFLLPVEVTAALAFVLVAGSYGVYARYYARAAARVRERLA